MQMNGEELISASRERVWEALNDPEILRQAIPGCESVEKTADDSFAATVKVKIGPVKATFKGNVTLSNIDAPNGYTITGEGKGGAAGFGKGGADITLKDADNGTLLVYDVNASVGGKMAQIGSRLIDGTAKKLAGEFFNSFNELVSNAASEDGEAPATAPPSEDQSEAPIIAEDVAEKEAPQQSEPPSQGWMKPSILIPLGIVAAIILYYLAGS
jgi:uncharacterized protein